MSDIIVQIAVEGEIDIFVYQVRESTSSPSGSVAWGDVTDKPSTFAPSAHDHSIDEIDGLQQDLNDRALKATVDSQLENKADLVDGVIASSQIPAIAVSEFLGDINSDLAMLSLNGQRGDWCIRIDLNRTAVLIADDASLLSNWRYLEVPGSPVTSVNGQTGTIVLSKANIGLGAVDNTSDADKPISTAQAIALAGKAPSVHDHPISKIVGLQSALDELTAAIAAKIDSVVYSNTMGDTIAASSTSFYSPQAITTDSSEANRQIVIPFPCVIESYTLRTSSAQPLSGALTITVTKQTLPGASVLTDMTFVIPAGGAAAVYSTAIDVPAATGDLISIRGVNAATAASAIFGSHSLVIRRILP